MNSIIESYYPLFRLYSGLREQLMEILDDQDLGCQLGGDNPTVGALCWEIGEVERAYMV
jgi:hypothetical protein